MKLTKRTLAATFAALLIGGMTINPASAAVKRFGDTWGDLNSATHGPATAEVNPFGPAPGHTYSRADISSLTHRGLPGANSYGRLAKKNFGWSDISSITHK